MSRQGRRRCESWSIDCDKPEAASFCCEDAAAQISFARRRRQEVCKLALIAACAASMLVVAMVWLFSEPLFLHINLHLFEQPLPPDVGKSLLLAKFVFGSLLATIGHSSFLSDTSFSFHHNGNRVLNQGLDAKIFQSVGPHATRYTVRNDSFAPPLGCTVEVVNTLERHGARLQGDKMQEITHDILGKIRFAIEESGKNVRLPPELKFLESVSLAPGTYALVPYGALQAYYSGMTTAADYRELAKKPAFVRSTGDIETGNDRCILSSKFWRLGFEGGRFPQGSMKTPEDVREAAHSLPEPDLILSELAGRNNSLRVENCRNQNEWRKSSKKGKLLINAGNELVQSIRHDIEARLARAGMKNLKFTNNEILQMGTMCSYETWSNAKVYNGRLEMQQSPFCNLMNHTQWQSLGYAYDLMKYYDTGFGNPFYKGRGTGFVRELVARFTNTAPNLYPPTSINATIDADAKNFPLPDPEKGPFIYYDATHDKTLAPIVAALNLFNGPALDIDKGKPTPNYKWIFSQISPVGGKIVFEKLHCKGRRARLADPRDEIRQPPELHSSHFVRVRANGAVLDAGDWCAPGDAGDGLCALPQFLKQTEFANHSREWDKCFD